VSTDAPVCDDSSVIGTDGDGQLLLGKAQRWAYKNLVPLNAAIEITQRCNIRCLHCYNFDRDEPRAACGSPGASDKPELSTEEILRVMGELRAAGCLFLLITGGEVLSHADLFRFLDRARELNLSVQLLTNATMLRPGVAKRIASYENLQGVSVSIYGATPAVHDGITQMPGSFRRTWDGIRRLRQLGVVVRVKFILMRQNAHEVAAMRAHADAEGLAYIVDLTITSRHDFTRGSLSTRMDAATVEELYRGPLRDLGVKAGSEPTEASWPCNCARGNVAITAQGDVQPCISVPLAAGNVREQPFADIWKHSPVFQQLRGYKLADYAACAPCDHKRYCGRSRGAAITASGSYTGVDPFVCETAETVHRLVDEAARPPVRARLAVLG
jgi:radical SAM protein with 4Fe4S-binding SPASM domain